MEILQNYRAVINIHSPPISNHGGISPVSGTIKTGDRSRKERKVLTEKLSPEEDSKSSKKQKSIAATNNNKELSMIAQKDGGKILIE